MALDNHRAFINENLNKQIEPLLVNAELQIKLLIRNYLINNWNKNELAANIDRIIARAINQLPQETPNKEELFLGLKKSSGIWYNNIRNQLNPILIRVGILTKQKVDGKFIELAINKIETGKDRLVLKSQPELSDLATVQLVEQLTKLNYILKEMASYGLQTDYVPGQTPVSLFAKLEMANRYNNNMTQLRDKLEGGEQIVRFSQHRDCSERCVLFQGKAVHLLAPAIGSPPTQLNSKQLKTYGKQNNQGFVKQFDTGIRLPDGEMVLSYQAITSIVDERGWQNNIHKGFNCRHYLKDIDDKKPDPYEAKTIKASRIANHNLRNMERAIRNLKKQYYLLIGKNSRRILRIKIDEAIKKYYQYAKDNNVVAYGWRLETGQLNSQV